ncbi:hypothetical protein [Streptomyces rubiginosohelvolus]
MNPREGEEHALLFVRVWAEAVLRQAARVQDARDRAAVNDRDYERMEDWSPTEEDLARDFREEWAEQHTLVWAAFQLEQWRSRLHKERGIAPPEEDPLLRTVRNALEHLTDAAFVNERAVSPGEAGQKGSALRKLPGSELEIALWGEKAFGHIDPVHVRNAALDLVRTIENDLEEEAVERYLALVEGLSPYKDE